jgi:hypothetical protein
MPHSSGISSRYKILKFLSRGEEPVACCPPAESRAAEINGKKENEQRVQTTF